MTGDCAVGNKKMLQCFAAAFQTADKVLAIGGDF